MCRRRTLQSRPSAGRAVPSRWRTRWSPNSPAGIRHCGPGAHTSPGLRWRSCARWRRMRNCWCSVSWRGQAPPEPRGFDGRRSRPDVRAAWGAGPQCPGGRRTARPRRRREPRERRPQPGPRRWPSHSRRPGCTPCTPGGPRRRPSGRFPPLRRIARLGRTTWCSGCRTRCGRGVGALAHAAGNSGLVVVGRHSGRTALSLLPHTGCPVAVVPAQPCSGSQTRRRHARTAAEDVRPRGWGPSAYVTHRGHGPL